MTDDVIHPKRKKIDSQLNLGRSENESIIKNWQIKSILSDEYYEPLRRRFVYAGILNDKKLIANALSELCQCMPLNGLNHLKRVNQAKLLLCTLSEMSDFLRENSKNESIQKVFSASVTTSEDDLRLAELEVTISLLRLFMENRGVSPAVVTSLTQNIEISQVAAQPPMLKWQLIDVNRDWPCKFFPNEDMERLYNGTWFTADETAFHLRIMEICSFLRNKLKKDVCGIAVDPRTKSIVAIDFDEIDRHPLMHCAMVLIDAVARSQKGGAWNKFLAKNDDSALYTKCESNSDEYTQSGVSLYIRKLISSKFPSVTFGAERVKSAAENRHHSTETDVTGDNLTKYGPYLCTGYDVYLWREPCIMCSMALTHSRIRAIFFQETQLTGAVCTITKLQSVKALNHHFQVFHITEDN